MATGMTSTRRFIVRLSLVTGSTLATIIGAQSLASFDGQALVTGGTAEAASPVQAFIPEAAAPELQPTQNINVPEASSGQFAADQSGIVHAPPAITILRHPGQATTTAASSSAAVQIQPPSPVEVAPPPPVVVQAPAQVVVQPSAPAAAPAPVVQPQPRTRSSR